MQMFSVNTLTEVRLESQTADTVLNPLESKACVCQEISLAVSLCYTNIYPQTPPTSTFVMMSNHLERSISAAVSFTANELRAEAERRGREAFLAGSK